MSKWLWSKGAYLRGNFSRTATNLRSSDHILMMRAVWTIIKLFHIIQNCLQMCCSLSKNRIPANSLANTSRHVRFSNAVIFSDNTRGCLRPFETVSCSDRWAASLSRTNGLESRQLAAEDASPRDSPNGDCSPKMPIRKLSSLTPEAVQLSKPIDELSSESKPKEVNGGALQHNISSTTTRQRMTLQSLLSNKVTCAV